jgi:hypothetical protein
VLQGWEVESALFLLRLPSIKKNSANRYDHTSMAKTIDWEIHDFTVANKGAIQSVVEGEDGT